MGNNVSKGMKEKPEVVEAVASATVEELMVGVDNDVIKETAKNVFEWAVGGKSAGEIMKTLGLNAKEWKELKRTFPVIMAVMEKGKDFATSYAALSIYELAMPTTVVDDEVVTHETVVDEQGNRRQVPKVVTVRKHIDASVRLKAAQYILENKKPDMYGAEKKEPTDNKAKQEVKQLSVAEKKELQVKLAEYKGSKA